MTNQKQFDWNEFQNFFSNFNPHQYTDQFTKQSLGEGVSPFIQELLKGKLIINTSEKGNDFLVDIMLPDDIDFEKIKHKVVTKSRPSGKKYKTLNVTIPRKLKED